jgi:nickel-type superoxide dismutase maturation protease
VRLHPTQHGELAIRGPAVSAPAAPRARTVRRAVVAAWRRHGLARVAVEGLSMAPTLLPGDRLVVRTGGAVRPGDLVAVVDPRTADRLLVKRVRTVGPDGIDVRGDDPAASTDSRTFGPVRIDGLRGRVVYRYAPRPRAGRLGRGRA